MKIRDSVPNGFVFNDGLSTPSCVQISDQIECGPVDIGSGSSGVFTVVFDVPVVTPCTTATVTNAAYASSVTTDSNPNNNVSNTVTTTVNCPAVSSSSSSSSAAQCADGADNDNDGLIDSADPGCHTGNNINNPYNAGDNDESNVLPQCNDGQDNDGDTLIDYLDPGCHSDLNPNNFNSFQPNDNDETNAASSSSSSSASSSSSSSQGNVADLTVSKTGPVTVTRGNTITYVLSAHNNGPGTAVGVTVADFYPVGLTFNQTASSNGCIEVIPGVKMMCYNFDLAPNETRSFNAVFNTAAPGDNCTASTLQNNAIIFSTSSDPVPSNNQSATVTTALNCPTALAADVTIAKSGPATAVRGANMTYQLTATNNGPGTANAVVIKDSVPAGFTFVAGASDASCTLQGSNVSCAVGTLTNGQFKSVAVTLLAQSSDQCTAVIFQNTATVSTTSSDAAHLSNTVSTTISCPTVTADVSIAKYGPASVTRGSTATYFLNVTNSGPATATNVVVTDAVPSGMTFTTAGSDSTCSLQGGSVSCALGNMTPGTRTVIIVFSVPTVTSCTAQNVTNTATVTSSITDPTPANNTSQTVSTTLNCQGNQGYQCSDGQDNDGDSQIDAADPGCHSDGNPINFNSYNSSDNDESNTAYQCSDARDNDSDGRTDYADPGCHSDGNPSNFNSYSPSDNDEADTVNQYQCNDGRDNDSDGYTDYPADPGCDSRTDNDESEQVYVCSDHRDNDQDGYTDYPSDPGCDSRTDNDEYDNVQNYRYECNDGRDNDRDGYIDYPEDPGCTSRNDTDEYDNVQSYRYECNDGRDNDRDGYIDYPEDPGCDTRNDNDEGDDDTGNRTYECKDRRDNDYDGLVDYPNDPGCSSTGDNSEYDNYAVNGTCGDNRDNDGDSLIDTRDPDCHTDQNPNNRDSFSASRNESSSNGNNGGIVINNIINNSSNAIVNAGGKYAIPQTGFDAAAWYSRHPKAVIQAAASGGTIPLLGILGVMISAGTTGAQVFVRRFI